MAERVTPFGASENGAGRKEFRPLGRDLLCPYGADARFYYSAAPSGGRREAGVEKMIKPYYDEDGITIYNADCRDVLRELATERFDAVITDPPFAFAGGISNGLASRADSQFFEAWLEVVFREMQRVSKHEAAWALWCDWRTAAIYDEVLGKSAADYYDQRRVSQVLIHDREMVGMGSPFRNQLDWIALVRGKKTDFGDRIPKNQPNIIRSYWYYGKHEFHPAEKSTKVAGMLIDWLTKPGDTILEPFLGGGAVLVAARAAGRKAVAIELEKGYCDVTIERLQQHSLFATV